MDEDLQTMTREQLIAEATRLREGIRAHRDTSLHDLSWHHPQLWGLLPERTDPQPAVPDWPEFLRGCIRYRQSLDEQLPRAPAYTSSTRTASSSIWPQQRRPRTGRSSARPGSIDASS